jgi:hypothetical protein
MLRIEKMIQVKKSYVVELSEQQARQLYFMLQSNIELLTIGSGYDELRPLYNELKKIFDSGVR